jgi:hypothetical protein
MEHRDHENPEQCRCDHAAEHRRPHGALGDNQRQKPEDKGEAGHHDRPEAQARAFDRRFQDRLAVAPLLNGELDDQDAILGCGYSRPLERRTRISILARLPPSLCRASWMISRSHTLTGNST